MVSYTCEIASVFDASQSSLIELDCEKESDSEDSKEAKEKFYNSDTKGLNGMYCYNKSLCNTNTCSDNLFISSGYSKAVYSPPWVF